MSSAVLQFTTNCSTLLPNIVGETKKMSLLTTMTTTTVALLNQQSFFSYESNKSKLHRLALDPLFVVLVIPLLLRVSDLVLRPVTGRTAPTGQGWVARVREQTQHVTFRDVAKDLVHVVELDSERGKGRNTKHTQRSERCHDKDTHF